MPTPIALLLEATERGFKLEAHGNQLHIIPVNPATRCPPDFAETLKAHKWHLLSMLSWPFVMVYSKALGETIFFCDDDDTKNCLIEAGAAPCCVYTLAELRSLLLRHREAPLSVDELLRFHSAKRMFKGKCSD